MKVNLVCVGKIKESYFTQALDEYKKRLSKFCNFSVIEVEEITKIKQPEQKSIQEGKLLLAQTRGLIVALDSKGKMLDSMEIANYIELAKVSGKSEISFIIGGSNGLSDEVLSRADLVLSFGKITFPHQLFRVVLTEQIYRAFTIIEGLPYHK